MDKVLFKRLLTLNRHYRFEIVMPNFILEEIIKKYGDDISESIKNMSKLKKDNELYRITDFNFDSIDKEKIIENYREKFNLLLKENAIDIIEYPKDENVIKVLSKKYFLNLKPFSKEKLSFQDAIIWHSITDFLKNKDRETIIHFITNNYKDFAKSKKEKESLSEDLEADIYNDMNKKVYLYNNLNSFLNKHKKSLDYVLSADEEEFEIEFNEQLENRIKEYFNNLEYISDSKIIEKELIYNNVLDYFIQEYLSEEWFYGYWLEGWGEDAYFDIDEIKIVQKLDYFLSNFEGYFEFKFNLDVNHSIYFVNPVYEDKNDDDFIYERDVDTLFKIKVSLEFIINYEIKKIKLEELDDIYDLEEFIEITDISIEAI